MKAWSASPTSFAFCFGDRPLFLDFFRLKNLRVAATVLAAVCTLAAAETVGQSGQQKSDQSQNAKTDKDSSDVYIAGGDVKPPKVIHYVEPAFSPSSQEAYVEGVVRIAAVVNLDGLPANLEVTKGLNAEEDKLAVEALKQWRFKPGTKNDRPVRVKINVEINFHLL